MGSKGLVFDIQRFSVNDGPGIRTTIFLKGCSLRCRWCHNPESISPRPQLSHNPKACILCGKCIESVQGDGIEIADSQLQIDFDKHNESFDLIEVCPVQAYRKVGELISVEELVSIVEKDKAYYENSDGGVTISGGEALNQIDFLCELEAALKEKGFHVCLDISGYNPSGHLERTYPFTDEYLLDYKLTDRRAYKKFLGVDFDFYETVEALERANKKITLRCPIIPGVNDNEKHLKSICDISQRYAMIQRVEILPYHNMMKSNRMKMINDQQSFAVPTEHDKEAWEKILAANGLKNGIIK